jgi:hypothetical protein
MLMHMNLHRSAQRRSTSSVRHRIAPSGESESTIGGDDNQGGSFSDPAWTMDAVQVGSASTTSVADGASGVPPGC